MVLLLVSFISGVLTVLAPCILPLLPIIIGGAAKDGRNRNPYLITASLALSIVIFTLALKFSTAFIDVPQSVWSLISGVIILFFGLISVFPEPWEKFNVKLGLQTKSDKLMADSAKKKGVFGDVLLGMSLGPVFSSCSPTYFVILATVLPQNFLLGTVYLLAYAAGLSMVLLLIALLGQRFVQKMKWAADPRGWFKRGLGILFILVAIFILTGADKRVQTFLLEKGYFNITNFEQTILEKAIPEEETSVENYPQYKEIVDPSGFVNTDEIILEELVGEKIILLDFMTYSCINCIRTFPYLNEWYDEYSDEGLEIIGIHTPEFAFEKDIENVEAAMEKYGIEFPVVLDNEYATWNAYGNRYWPRKYLIDLEGNIVYDHIGEGNYDETENKIRELLGLTAATTEKVEEVASSRLSVSPETYVGAERNETLSNGERFTVGEQDFDRPTRVVTSLLYLVGTWNIEGEFAESISETASILFRYKAKNVFIVASADEEVQVEVRVNDKPISESLAGLDVYFENGKSYIDVQNDDLYRVIEGEEVESELLELIPQSPGLQIYTFTFGR